VQRSHYEDHPAARGALSQATKVLEVASFAPEHVDEVVLAEHRRRPFDALLCLLHIRTSESARLARLIGARFLNPDSAALLMDKHAVRLCLAERGLPQPEFALAKCARELTCAVQRVGLPAIIKPADGYGSERIIAIDDPDCQDYLAHMQLALRAPLAYGFGAQSSGRLLVERRLTGRLLGCDTFTAGGSHRLLGIHEKQLFAASKFSIRGGTFSPGCLGLEPVRDYVFAVLDAVGFDWGAAHVELYLTDDGPRLVEVNPRLVGAGIPRLVGLATGRDMISDLIALHLGESVPEPAAEDLNVAVTRWLGAPRDGILAAIEWPRHDDPRIQGVDVYAQRGAHVCRPHTNGDRLACVRACAKSRDEAEAAAEGVIAGARVVMEGDA
jgi:biotin carboxylase